MKKKLYVSVLVLACWIPVLRADIFDGVAEKRTSGAKNIRTIIFDMGGVLFKPSKKRRFDPIEEGISLLAECSAHEVYVCTNYASKVVEYLVKEYPEHFESVKGYITPDKAHAKKPRPEIFQYLISHHSIVPQESIFIDDTLANVEAARNAGFIGIHAADMVAVRAQLVALGCLK